MAEITDREYELLTAALQLNNTAINSVSAIVTDLRILLSTKYLTKEDDVENDRAIYNHIEDIRADLQNQIHIIIVVVTIIFSVIIALVGWILTHKG